jgi:hypothetical protein
MKHKSIQILQIILFIVFARISHAQKIQLNELLNLSKLDFHQFDTQVQKYKLEFVSMEKTYSIINEYQYLARGNKLYGINYIDFPESPAITYMFEDNALYQKMKLDLANSNFKFNKILNNGKNIDFNYSRGNIKVDLFSFPKSESNGEIKIIYTISIVQN